MDEFYPILNGKIEYGKCAGTESLYDNPAHFKCFVTARTCSPVELYAIRSALRVDCLRHIGNSQAQCQLCETEPVNRIKGYFSDARCYSSLLLN